MIGTRWARLGVLVAPLSLGCYVNQPLMESRPEPASGTNLVVELTDDGRVALGPSIGAGTATVEGTLVQRSDSQYVLGVTHVTDLWGHDARWEGEQVAVGARYVRRMFVRKLSPGRTALFVTAGTVGFAAFVLTRNLLGGGTQSNNNTGGGSNNGT